MNVFQLAGIYCQPLAEFASLFHIHVGNELENVWIGHKYSQKRLQLQQSGLSCLAAWSGQLPNCNNRFTSCDSAKLLSTVVNSFKRKTLVDYIFQDSFLLIRTDNDSFEEIFASNLNNILQRTLVAGGKRRLEYATFVAHKKLCRPQINKIGKTWFRWPREFKKGKLPAKPVPQHRMEGVSLDYVLYDGKPPTKIKLSENLDSIIHSPTSESYPNFRKVYDSIIQQEKSFSSKNGYYRLFKKHVNYREADNQVMPVPKGDVISFACDILKQILPSSFFGNSNRIRKRFNSVIAQFIRCRKQQVFSLYWLTECFVPQPEWFKEIGIVGGMKFLKFLVCNVLANTLKNFFYITECGSSGYALFYYEKSSFESVTARKINELVKRGVLKKVDEDDNLERRWLENRLAPGSELTEMENLMPDRTEYQPPAAKVRFLPKTPDSCELRMITIAKAPPLNDHKRKLFVQRQLERIDVVGVVKRLLDYLILKTGTGIQPLYTSHELRKWWEKIKEMKKMGNELYFVKADISDAFGSVNHDRLFKLIERWCNKIGNWKELLICEWLIRRGKLQKVSRFSFSRKLLPNRVLHSVQYSQRKEISNVFIISVLKQIVTLQCLRVGRVLYRVQAGLCQGGAGGLSPRLCDLYYSGFDAGLRSLVSGNQSLLLRGMDDFLYVTLLKSKAIDFYNIVRKGVPLFNTQFNEKKLVTNIFDQTGVFPYLGLIFDVDLLTVAPNFSRYEKTDVLNFVKLAFRGNDPRLGKGNFIVGRCLNFISLKLVPIIYENKESGDLFLKKVLISACDLQVRRILGLALYLKSPADTLKFVFHKVSAKLTNVIQKMCPSISRFFTIYVFYQICFQYFHKYDSRFANVTKIIQMRLIYVYQRLDVNPSEIEMLLNDAAVRWWKPWKNICH